MILLNRLTKIILNMYFDIEVLADQHEELQELRELSNQIVVE